MNHVMQVLRADRLHHALKKRSRMTVNPELRGGHSLSYSCERVDREIDAVSFDQGPMVHDHEGLARRVRRRGERARRPKSEDLLIGRIHYDAKLLRTATARGEQLLAGEVDRERQISQLDAPLLESLKGPNG